MGSGTPGDGFRLGIDFGTWNTSAILRWPDGHARPLLFDGSPLLPSAVYAEPDGRLLVGRDAVHAARLDPARLEPNPKRRVQRDSGDTAVVLGDQEVTVSAMVAAVLGRVGDEAVRVSGVPLAELPVTLTHPAGWDPGRIGTLRDGGLRAGLGEPRLVAEPVAAAGYFVSVLGRAIAAGSALVVYDFGAGTFDASVVAPAADGSGYGYRVLAVAGLPDVGGLDLDTALLRHVATRYHDTDPQAWLRLDEPRTPADRRHRRHLVEDVRAAKEMLSRATTATVPVPLLELEARVTREEFDELARPLLERTVSTTVGAIAAAGLAPDRVAGVLLVGGSSRIPLVAELLRARTGHTPSTIDQPETVVAEGSIRLSSGGSGLTRAGSPVAVAPAGPAAGSPAPADPWAEALQAQQTTAITPAVPAHAGPVTAVPAPTVVAPTRPMPAVAPAPVKPRYAPPSPPPYQQGGAYLPTHKRRWPAILAGVLVLAVAAAGVVFGLPYVLDAINKPGGTGNPSAASRPPYNRLENPAWLPAGWTGVVDDAAEASVVPGPAANGGDCVYSSPGVLHVTRSSFDISGCQATTAIRQLVVSDAAVEAQFSVVKGCGGMWLRTGHQGYFVAVCSDGSVALHKLGDDPPSRATLIGQPWTGANPAKVVVAVVARGLDPVEFEVYLDGVAQPRVVDPNSPLPTGRVALGGFGPHPIDAVDATIARFRVWAPTGATTTA